MNFGDCPYCDGFMGMFEVPDRTPAYAIVQCGECGKDVWYKFSRIDPQSWTVEDFEEEFNIDHATMKIEPKNQVEEPEIPEYIKEIFFKYFEDRIINGDGTSGQPLGIMHAFDVDAKEGGAK